MGTFKTKYGDLIFSIVCIIITIIFAYLFINAIRMKNFEGMLCIIGIIVFGYLSYLYFRSFLVREK